MTNQSASPRGHAAIIRSLRELLGACCILLGCAAHAAAAGADAPDLRAAREALHKAAALRLLMIQSEWRAGISIAEGLIKAGDTVLARTYLARLVRLETRAIEAGARQGVGDAEAMSAIAVTLAREGVLQVQAGDDSGRDTLRQAEQLVFTRPGESIGAAALTDTGTQGRRIIRGLIQIASAWNMVGDAANRDRVMRLAVAALEKLGDIDRCMARGEFARVLVLWGDVRQALAQEDEMWSCGAGPTYWRNVNAELALPDRRAGRYREAARRLREVSPAIAAKAVRLAPAPGHDEVTMFRNLARQEVSDIAIEAMEHGDLAGAEAIWSQLAAEGKTMTGARDDASYRAGFALACEYLARGRAADAARIVQALRTAGATGEAYAPAIAVLAGSANDSAEEGALLAKVPEGDREAAQARLARAWALRGNMERALTALGGAGSIARDGTMRDIMVDAAQRKLDVAIRLIAHDAFSSEAAEGVIRSRVRVRDFGGALKFVQALPEKNDRGPTKVLREDGIRTLALQLADQGHWRLALRFPEGKANGDTRNYWSAVGRAAAGLIASPRRGDNDDDASTDWYFH